MFVPVVIHIKKSSQIFMEIISGLMIVTRTSSNFLWLASRLFMHVLESSVMQTMNRLVQKRTNLKDKHALLSMLSILILIHLYTLPAFWLCHL